MAACAPYQCWPRVSWGVRGPPGATGATGAAGPPGPPASVTGSVGPDGPTGATGATGPTVRGARGAVGLTGSTGRAGFVGATGAKGAVGFDGAMGPQGATGASPAGAAGPTGPVGASGAVGVTPTAVTNIVNFYGTVTTTFTVAPGAAVQFPSAGPVQGSGIYQTSLSSFRLGSVGTYMVQFSVPVHNAGQLGVAIAVDDVLQVQDATVVGRDLGDTAISGVCLITTTLPDQVLSIVNPSTVSDLIVDTATSGGSGANFQLIITQLV